MSASAPAFMEGSAGPDGQCLRRIQMALSAPPLRWHRANARRDPPSVWPSSASSPPWKFSLHNYLISSLLKQHLESEHLPRVEAGKPAFVSKCPFCSLHNFHSERMPYTPKWATKKKKGAAVNAMAQHTHPFLIAFWFQGEIIIAHCHAIVTGRLELHFLSFLFFF